jgi:FixJ family two-component response regulator
MRERVSDLAVVAISGIATLDFVSQWPELANVVCLQKPFRPNDLMVAIEAARQAVWQSTAAVVSQKAWPSEPKRTPRRTGT